MNSSAASKDAKKPNTPLNTTCSANQKIKLYCQGMLYLRLHCIVLCRTILQPQISSKHMPSNIVDLNVQAWDMRFLAMAMWLICQAKKKSRANLWETRHLPSTFSTIFPHKLHSICHMHHLSMHEELIPKQVHNIKLEIKHGYNNCNCKLTSTSIRCP